MNHNETKKRLRKTIGRLEINGSLYKIAVGQLPLEDLNYKFDENTWSIAQCVEHIMLTNNAYLTVFRDHIEHQNKTIIQKIPLLPNLFGNLVLKAVEPNRFSRSKTFKLFNPKDSTAYDATILDEFLSSQAEMIQCCEQLLDLELEEHIICSPVSSLIPLKIRTAIEIVVNHQIRHYHQIEEVIDSLASVEA